MRARRRAPPRCSAARSAAGSSGSAPLGGGRDDRRRRIVGAAPAPRPPRCRLGADRGARIVARATASSGAIVAASRSRSARSAARRSGVVPACGRARRAVSRSTAAAPRGAAQEQPRGDAAAATPSRAPVGVGQRVAAPGRARAGRRWPRAPASAAARARRRASTRASGDQPLDGARADARVSRATAASRVDRARRREVRDQRVDLFGGRGPDGHQGDRTDTTNGSDWLRGLQSRRPGPEATRLLHSLSALAFCLESYCLLLAG